VMLHRIISNWRGKQKQLVANCRLEFRKGNSIIVIIIIIGYCGVRAYTMSNCPMMVKTYGLEPFPNSFIDVWKCSKIQQRISAWFWFPKQKQKYQIVSKSLHYLFLSMALYLEKHESLLIICIGNAIFSSNESQRPILYCTLVVPHAQRPSVSHIYIDRTIYQRHSKYEIPEPITFY
jgi:hypothetical protein